MKKGCSIFQTSLLHRCLLQRCADTEGVEPSPADSKSDMLPLHHASKSVATYSITVLLQPERPP